MLTLEKLKALPPNSIIAQGEIVDSPVGLNIQNSGQMLRWVAVRGVVHDWTIYCHFAKHPYEWIKDHGDKVVGKRYIEKLVSCDGEAFSRYRF